MECRRRRRWRRRKSNKFENLRFLYLRETKSWRWEGEEGEEEGGEEGEGEKVSLLTHTATLAGVGKNKHKCFDGLSPTHLKPPP